MRVALRCDRHRHGIVDTETQVLEIHCRNCSKAEGRPVYHHWRVIAETVRGADLEEWHEGPDHRRDPETDE